MIGKGKTRTKLLLVCAVVATTCSAQAAGAQASDLSQAQAKKEARTAVTESDSYKQIKSSFALKVRSCKVSGNRASCKLFRSVSQPCGLSGGPKPGQLCTNNVAHRAWSVKVTGSAATIVSTSNVIGQFEPSDSADSARRNR
jgi:hypothetical protein